jgi:hypothetical protein
MTERPSTGATCARHPGVPAVEVCARCGAFACADCVEYVDESTAVCAGCARPLDGGLVRRAWVSLALSGGGVAGMLAGLGLYQWRAAMLVWGIAPVRSMLWAWGLAIPVGLVGLVLARRASVALRGHLGASRIQRVARVASVLGLVHAVMTSALLVFVVSSIHFFAF